MFPIMSPEGARGAVAWYAATRIFDAIDAGHFLAEKPKYAPLTAQQALDAVTSRVRSKR